MILRNGVVYGSMNDIAGLLDIKTFHNTTTRKLECSSNRFTIRIAADNPFIVAADERQAGTISQMPVDVIQKGETFFVPIAFFAPVLGYVLGEEVTFNPAETILTIGRWKGTPAYDITGLSFEEKSNGYLIRVRCGKKLKDYDSWLRPEGDDTWLYVTLVDARADAPALRAIKPTDFIKQLHVFPSPGSVQLTFRVRGRITATEVIPADESDDILLTLHKPTDEQLAEQKARVEARNKAMERSRWKLDVIVIDAGHGGDDPGTIGVRGTKEKDITLAIALKLGKLIETKLPDVRIVYTRKTDTFVELYRRGQIANENGGKLFISIHCNSARRKPHPARGFEIYLLRPGKTEAALAIAERENEVIKLEEGYEQRYQQLTEENFILLTMAQSAYVKYSEQFADILQQEMAKRMNIDNNGVKQAGFLVLVGASMPNALIETGYLSNRDDEKMLRSPKGQQTIAEAIFGGVQRYKAEYERALEEGKDLGTDMR